MPVIRNTNIKKYDIPTAQFATYAAPSLGSKETAVWRIALKAKSEGLTHQLTREEIILAIDGSAIADIDGERHVVSAGETLIIPAYVDFALSNPNEAGFAAIAIFPVGGQAVVGKDVPFTPPWAA
jgi:quercetin dioxygenase-like cupin family protein